MKSSFHQTVLKTLRNIETLIPSKKKKNNKLISLINLFKRTAISQEPTIKKKKEKLLSLKKLRADLNLLTKTSSQIIKSIMNRVNKDKRLWINIFVNHARLYCSVTKIWWITTTQILFQLTLTRCSTASTLPFLNAPVYS